MKLLHAVIPAGPQVLVEVTLSRPNANVMLLDEQNWWLYQRGMPFRFHAGGFFNANIVKLRAPFHFAWHLVIDLGGAMGEIAASYRLVGA